MLGAGLELVSPRGPVERYAPFTWRYALPRGGRFELVVLDRSTGEGGRELLRKTLEPPRPSRETTCDLSAEEEDALTSDILWTLRVLAADGDELAYAEERARRSSR